MTSVVTATDTNETVGAASSLARARRIPRDYYALAAFVLLAATLPFFLTATHMAIANRVLIFAIMGVGWNIMAGFGGMFSFGHAAFFGVGAYATAFSVATLKTGPWVGLLIGVVLAVAAGVGISYLALRYKLTGAYYTMSTFAFAEALRLFVQGSEPLKKTVGITIPVKAGQSFADFQFSAGSPWYYWIGLALLGLCLLASIAFLNSRHGRFTLAVRDNDLAAAALGINVLRYKLQTVALSAAITAVAGTFYVQYYMFIDPHLAFGASVSNDAIITAVVGGTGTIWGPVIGAVVMAPLSDLVAGWLRHPPAGFEWLSGQGGLDIVLYAVILIAVVTLLPKGIYGTIVERRRQK